MSTPVFVAVIVAALLHAVWNALVKGGTDKHLSMCAVVLGHLPLAILALLFVPAPAAASFPFLIAGIGLHAGYQIFLLNAYRSGDLTQVYPIARGSAPLIVAGFSIVVLGVRLQPLEMLAILVIGTGILSMSLVRRNDGLRNHRAAMLALITGGFIAAYSLVDGHGARLAGTALGFFSWLAIGNGLVFVLYVLAVDPRVLLRIPTQGRRVFLIGGSASYTAYALVVWAFTQAPVPLVTALRETSIIFALLIGVGLLKERMDVAKVLSIMATLLGAVLLRFARQ
jgi:drug/metabolite transporter (DMT)-like permease